jgi:predicted N-acyltransferase
MHNHDHHDELIKQKRLNIKTRREKGVQHGVHMEQKRKVKKKYEAWCSLCPCYFSLCNMKHMMGSIDITMIATMKI